MSTAAKKSEQPAYIPDREMVEEAERIRGVYARRRRDIPSGRYALAEPFTLYSTHEREAAMVALFRKAGLSSLEGLRILDVGCGRGELLRRFMSFGAAPDLLSGVDLVDEYVEAARKLAPHLQISCGSADRLPFTDRCFDMVSQFTLLTSVLDPEMKQAIANEMARVMKPGGWLLWYDFSYNNPRNPDVHGIGKAEIRRLFPSFSMSARRVTLAPPLGRMVAPLSPLLYHVLVRLKFLCTHYICLLRKPGEDSKNE
jgi:ubiquinone/menaquinone biosynthesis C-methylase UbiE